MIDLHDYERTDWIHGRNLLPGDQLDSGHLVTDVDDTLISHVRVVLDGDTDAAVLIAAHAKVTVIRPAAEPAGNTNRVRDQHELVALPATTTACVCSCGKDCHSPAGLASHQRASKHVGTWDA